MSNPTRTPEDIAAGLDKAERALILSFSAEPSRIGTRATWTERKGIADGLPNGLVLRKWVHDAHRYSLSDLGLAVKAILEKDSRHV